MTRKQNSQTASETGMTQEQQKQEQQQAEQMSTPRAESSQQPSKGKKGGSKKTEEKKGGGAKNKEGGAKKNAKTSSQEGKSNKNQASEKGKKGTLSPIPVSVVKSIKQKMDDEHPGMVKNMNEVKMVTEKFLETIVEMAKNKQSVALPNFFTFKPVLRNERVHRNPQNGSIVTKPAHYVLCMDVKNKLKTDIASIPVEEEEEKKKETASSGPAAQ